MVSLLALVSVVLLGARLGGAVPAGKTARAAIDNTLLDTFKLMEQYAKASYCKSNFGSPGDQIRCNGGGCPLVEAANATSVIEYSSKLSTGVTGYVAVDPKHSLIVVSFRGSASIENWLTNLDFEAVSTNLCSGCTAHRGFWQSWQDTKGAVTTAIKDLAAANPTYQIIATGHSLGGAIATLAAADLRNAGYKVTLYSFGAPRVSSAKLADYITKQAGGNFRVTHYNDPVPNVPPIIMNFAHVSPEYYINKKNNQVVSAGDIQIFEGNMNLKGNAAWVLTDIFAHLFYFEAFPVNCIL